MKLKKSKFPTLIYKSFFNFLKSRAIKSMYRLRDRGFADCFAQKIAEQ